MKLKDILDKKLKRQEEYYSNKSLKLVKGQNIIKKDAFKKYMVHNIKLYLLKNNQDYNNFKLTKFNNQIIELLYLYATNSKFSNEYAKKLFGNQYEFDNKKSLMFYGRIRSGKTMMMTAYLQTLLLALSFVRNFNKKILIINSYNLSNYIKNKNPDNVFNSKMPIFIDDIGKEPDTVNIYGVQIEPVKWFIANSYDNGNDIYLTTNLNMEALTERYSFSIVSRIIDKCNIIQFNNKNLKR